MPDFEGQSPVCSTVFDRFPDRADAVRRLVFENEHFRSLCEDHALAVEALARFTDRIADGSHPADQDRQREYAALVSALEREIEHVIDGRMPHAGLASAGGGP